MLLFVVLSQVTKGPSVCRDPMHNLEVTDAKLALFICVSARMPIVGFKPMMMLKSIAVWSSAPKECSLLAPSIWRRGGPRCLHRFFDRSIADWTMQSIC